MTARGGRTALDAARELTRRLEAAGRAEPAALAEWAVAAVLGVGRATLRAGLAPTPSAGAVAQLDRIAARLLAGEPLAYALGWAEFLGRPFAMDGRAMIPRPETEELATLVLREALPPGAVADVWDIGTGSGVLAITFALERPTARITATDLDPAALDLARANAARHHVADRIRWIAADLFGDAGTEVADLVVSNPPYVARSDLSRLAPEVRDHEPRIALDGGPDGLEVIRRLIPAAFTALRPGGRLYLEIGDAQGAAVLELMTATGFTATRLLRDMSCHGRFATAQRPGR
ncbi:MAG: peptide chain release factor N(5)-glutamine methyltransferase [Kiritimatiellae bacterium]|nr:peptide chain release factor N(5)-glutamine methyltransferase [Kiritimatiellia bacterium]